MRYEFAKLIYNKSSIDKLDKKIRLLGTNCGLNTMQFLNFRIFSFIILFFVILYISKFGYILAPVVSLIYYFGIEWVMIDSKIKKRQKQLEGEAITFFEILSLMLDAGRNLENAIRITSKNTKGKLSLEFDEVIREVGLGKGFVDALNDLEKRIPSDNINNIILSLIESDVYGSSIISSLNSQIEYLREKRKMEVKAEISKVPIRISIISVLFFIPLVLLIILGPVLLSYIS